ncbi:small guanosine triphosphatase family protein [Ceratobasidium sp. AG-Ba]|nr:small guanosine triphosphatase family protein [Ceratobasidium sp. AG-Ba]
MLGDGGVGKTALAVQVCCLSIPPLTRSSSGLQRQVAPGTYDPTIEDAFRHSVVVDDEMTYLEIVDTAGQEEYATLRDQWIREGEGFILVYSIASRRSYDRIRAFQHRPVKRGSRPVHVSATRQMSGRCPRRKALRCRQWGCPFLETSAKTAHNVDRMFTETVRTLRLARDGDRPRRALTETKDSKPTKIKKHRGCKIL